MEGGTQEVDDEIEVVDATLKMELNIDFDVLGSLLVQ